MAWPELPHWLPWVSAQPSILSLGHTRNFRLDLSQSLLRRGSGASGPDWRPRRSAHSAFYSSLLYHPAPWPPLITNLLRAWYCSWSSGPLSASWSADSASHSSRPPAPKRTCERHPNSAVWLWTRPTSGPGITASKAATCSWTNDAELYLA